MLTLGIDLATTKGITGICEIDWSTGQSTIQVPSPRVANARLVNQIRKVIQTNDGDGGGWTAIDAPFGFPAAFTRAVHDWETRGTVAPSTLLADDWIRWRLTDRYVEEQQRVLGAKPNPWPLSTVSSFITPTVIRCAQILSGVEAASLVDRVGLTSHVVEAYPAAALRVWGISPVGYKKAGNGSAASASQATECYRILKALCGLAQLPVPALPTAARGIDDAVDAFVCALVARAVALAGGATGPLTVGRRYAAHITTVAQEGWIHLPPPVFF